MANYDPTPSAPENGLPAAAPALVDVKPDSLLEIVWRRRWMVLLTVGVSMVAALIYLARATPVFESSSRLYVEQSGPKIITEQVGVMTQSKNYLYTQAELLKSTSILAPVADDPSIGRMKSFDRIDNPLGYLKKTLNTGVGKKDDIIEVSFESPYPQEAAQIVNKVVDAYITYHETSKRHTAGEILKFLNKEKVKTETILTAGLQAQLDFIRENSGFTFDGEGGSVVLQRLAQLSGALTLAQLETINAKAGYKTVKLMIQEPGRVRQLVEAQRANGVYISMNNQASQLRGDRKELQTKLKTFTEVGGTDQLPIIRALQARIAEIDEQLQAEEIRFAESYLEVSRQRWVTTKDLEEEILASYNEQEKLARGLSAKTAQFNILQAEVSRAQTDWDIITSDIKELTLSATEDVGALYITILEYAKAGAGPIKPQKSRIMAMALVLSLMLGVGLALLLDFLDTRLRSADEIGAILQLPVLGTVPSMSNKEGFTAHGQKVNLEPTSPIAEAYRTIRTAVYFGVPEGQAKTVLVTSPAPGDGKSTLVSNLAITMAQAGQRTLILDCDFRKPVQHTILELDQEPGLSSVLAGQADLEEVIQRTCVEGMDILTCGPIPPNPSEMLGSGAFARAIEQLSQRYDRLVIDSPPVMAVTDARILGALCDVTLLVLRAAKSTRKAGQQARDGLMSVGAHILGAVVNDVQRSKGRYGYYSGYGYEQYGYGYGREGGQGRSRKNKGAPAPDVAKMTRADEKTHS